MRRLWILRHAKAVPHVPDDHGRALVARGERQCASVAEQLLESPLAGQFPRLVLTSSAVRALSTAQLVVEHIGAKTTIEVEKPLYQASPDDVLERLRELRGTSSVVVVGHNPTLSELVPWLLDPGDTKGYRKVHNGLPTCGLAVVRLGEKRWAELTPGSGRLELFVVPKGR